MVTNKRIELIEKDLWELKNPPKFKRGDTVFVLMNSKLSEAIYVERKITKFSDTENINRYCHTDCISFCHTSATDTFEGKWLESGQIVLTPQEAFDIIVKHLFPVP